MHPFPVYEAAVDALTEARRDMWLWAELVIADCANDHYDRALSDRLASGIMARKHSRLWQTVIHDQPDSVSLITEELYRAAVTFGLDRKFVDDTNGAILEELVDIVLCRFRASRTATKTFSLVLMSATSCLGTARVAA